MDRPRRGRTEEVPGRREGIQREEGGRFHWEAKEEQDHHRSVPLDLFLWQSYYHKTKGNPSPFLFSFHLSSPSVSCLYFYLYLFIYYFYYCYLLTFTIARRWWGQRRQEDEGQWEGQGQTGNTNKAWTQRKGEEIEVEVGVEVYTKERVGGSLHFVNQVLSVLTLYY